MFEISKFEYNILRTRGTIETSNISRLSRTSYEESEILSRTGIVLIEYPCFR